MPENLMDNLDDLVHKMNAQDNLDWDSGYMKGRKRGEVIVFFDRYKGGSFIVNSDGSNPIKISTKSEGAPVAWSESGNIVYLDNYVSMNESVKRGLYEINVLTGDERFIPDIIYTDAFSSDYKNLIFVQNYDPNTNNNKLTLLDPVSGFSNQVTAFYSNILFPVRNPNANTFLFTEEISPGRIELFEFDLDSKSRSLVKSGLSSSDYYSYSQDGKVLLGKYDSLNILDNGLEELFYTFHTFANSLFPIPDSKNFFARMLDGTFYLINPVHNNNIAVSEGFVSNVSFAPDNNRLVFSNFVDEVYIGNISGQRKKFCSGWRPLWQPRGDF